MSKCGHYLDRKLKPVQPNYQVSNHHLQPQAVHQLCRGAFSLPGFKFSVERRFGCLVLVKALTWFDQLFFFFGKMRILLKGTLKYLMNKELKFIFISFKETFTVYFLGT